jgi:hypothetical protein
MQKARRGFRPGFSHDCSDYAFSHGSHYKSIEIFTLARGSCRDVEKGAKNDNQKRLG